jgi:hypothetical protein
MPCHHNAGQNLVRPVKVRNNSLRKCGKVQIFMKGSKKMKEMKKECRTNSV